MCDGMTRCMCIAHVYSRAFAYLSQDVADVFALDSDDEDLSDWTADFSQASTPRDAFFLPTDEELKAVASTGSPMEVADSAGGTCTTHSYLCPKVNLHITSVQSLAPAVKKPRRKVTFADWDVR